MRLKPPLWGAIGAACLGSLILALWFNRCWPATDWTVLSRDQAIAKARDVAKQFGFDAGRSEAHISGSVANPLALYRQVHPNDASARLISPLRARIRFGPDDEGAQVGIDSTGVPTYWSAPDEFKSGKSTAASEKEAAQQAFQLMAGASAPLFTAPSNAMDNDPKKEVYTWTKRPADQSEVREKVKITAENLVVTKAERTVTLASDDDADEETGDNRAYWGFLTAVFWTACTIGCVTLFSIYLLWLMRKALSHRFPIIIALATVVAMVAQRTNSGGTVFFSALLVMCLVAVGRAISPTVRPKWMSLEQLCLLAPVARSTGESLIAGVLCSPLLAGIPFLIAGCGLFPHANVVPRNAEVLYSAMPLVDSVNVGGGIYLLAFFGFGLPLLRRMFRYRWLRWLIALPLGILYFANATRVVTGPIAAPLTAGFCTLALFGLVYRYFDLLAVFTLQLASGIVLCAFIVGQKGGSFAPFALALGVLLAVGLWITQRGREVAEGDPRATTPALAGFRGEREKLQAEFSVAKRAQEGMLPAAPPKIPGYSIAASCTPSLDVGGDLYDFLELPDGRIGIGVADVSGKGVPAALYMTLTKGLLASVSQDSAELATVVDEVNKHLTAVTRKKVFVTMALGFLDAKRRHLQCVRAGHNPMVWRQPSKDETTLVAPAGLGLGITAGGIFRKQLKVVDMALTEGDAVVFYSDGITEAMNSKLEQFGEQRLMDVVAQTDNLDATATHDRILSAVREFLGGVHPQDDMTLVVLRVGDERMMVSG